MHWTRSFRRKLVRLRKCSFRFTSIRWKTEIDAASRRLHQPQSSSTSSGHHSSNLRSLRYSYQPTNLPISGFNFRLLHIPALLQLWSLGPNKATGGRYMLTDEFVANYFFIKIDMDSLEHAEYLV